MNVMQSSLQKSAGQNTLLADGPVTIQPWFEVQRYLGQLQVARQSGGYPLPASGQVLVRMVACGICASDVRVATGNKVVSGGPDRYVTPGHEGVGIVVATGAGVVGLESGDYVVVLPHIHLPLGHGTRRSIPQIEPACVGSGHTLHMGWDTDGVFADFIVVPVTNLIRVPSKQLHLAAELAPGLQGAIFALVEPMMCILSAYELIELYLQSFSQRELTPGRALIIGCGPIGVLHGLVLLKRGFEVWFADMLPKRAMLAQWCLGGRGHVFLPEHNVGEFDLVMVTASASDAIRTGELLVRDGGIVYLFAGLNTADLTAMDPANVFFYERLHRTAKGILTTTRFIHEDKTILYLGHSGYFDKLVTRAISTVAANAVELDRAITGIISGWSSPRIDSRLPGGADWVMDDGSPVIIAVLKGADLRDRHCKLLVLTNNQFRDLTPFQSSRKLRAS